MKMKNRKIFLLWTLSFSLLLGSMYSLSPQTKAQDEPRYGGTLVYGSGPPEQLNPAITSSHRTHFPASACFVGLVQFDMNMDPQPWLAESWEISSDALTYTFHLVQNATWHDGEPVTSADVKYTFDEVILPYHPRAVKWAENVDVVETPDDYTVVYTLKNAFAPFMIGMDAKFQPIIPKHLYEGTDPLDNEYNSNPVGCGPFVFEEWVVGDHITFVRNENYFRKGLPYLDRVIVQPVEHYHTMTLMLQNEEIHYTPVWTELPDVDALLADDRFDYSNEEYKGATSVRMIFFHYNTDRLIGQDKNLRIAIAHAVNKTKHVELVAFGHAIVTDTPFPPTIEWCHNPNPDPVYPYNVTKANEILDAAGYPMGQDGIRRKPDGSKLTLEGRASSSQPEMVTNIEIMKDELLEIGIDLHIDILDVSRRNEEVFTQHDFDIFFQGYESGPDPVIGMYRYLTTAAIQHVPWTNVAEYSNPELDALANAAAVSTDKQERQEIYYQMADIINEDLAIWACYERAFYSFWNREFHGFPIGPFGPAAPMDRIWWEGGEAPPPEGLPWETQVAIVAVVAVVAIAGVGVYWWRRT
jgi:peptide/nickel transport system substrate-binding protein